ncbi:MAG: hypothetical protein EBR81_12875 [Proteobacteria bacterium]|nr:hypothetical protein [Pseudomonadota bacterium]
MAELTPLTETRPASELTVNAGDKELPLPAGANDTCTVPEVVGSKGVARKDHSRANTGIAV